MVKLTNNEINSALDQEGKIEEVENNHDNYLGYEKWQKRDLKGYFEIKENFEDFKKKLQESINDGVINQILGEVRNDECAVIDKGKKREGLTFAYDDTQYGYSEELRINIKDDVIEVYTYEHYRDQGDYDDFIRISPSLNGNTSVVGNPYEFINDGTGSFSRNRILSVGVRGLMTYDDSKPISSEKLKAKLLAGEDNKIDSVQKYNLDRSKTRIINRLLETKAMTNDIKSGMAKTIESGYGHISELDRKNEKKSRINIKNMKDAKDGLTK